MEHCFLLFNNSNRSIIGGRGGGGGGGGDNDAMFFALNYPILRSRLRTGVITFHHIFF